MSNTLIDHSPDLKRLRDEGYEVEVRGSFLLVHHVPYVNARKEIQYGTLICPLTLATPTRAGAPPDHVMHFTGGQPCNQDGTVIHGLTHPDPGPKTFDSANSISSTCSFSNRPTEGFQNYYDKVVSYVRIISAPASALDNTVTARTHQPVTSSEPDYVFKYLDTNSSRAEIVQIAAKLCAQRVAIVGIGGTGSYVLDFLAKTPVREIHTFDGDNFFVHNAFRAPGAPAIDQFTEGLKKVSYLGSIYSNMHKYVIPHPYFLSADNVVELARMTFVFICIDDGTAKKLVVDFLLSKAIPFADCGMGVEAGQNALSGLLRVTTATAKKNDHVPKRIGFGNGADDDYSQNIQIAELNALNAALAVIKWKKLAGFYHDSENEHNAVYDLNVNKLLNDEAGA